MPKPALRKNNFSIKKKSKAKKVRKIYNPARLGITVLVILALLIFIGKTLGLINNLTHPYSRDISQNTASSAWDGKGSFNLVVKTQDIYVLSYNPMEKSVLLFKIPPDTYVDLPFNFGSWPIRSVYSLGQGEKVPFGARLLKETVSSVFGIQIDRAMIVSGKLNEKSLDTILEESRNNPLQAIALLQNSRTDLSALEYLRFWWQLRQIRFDKLKVVDLGQSDLTSWILLGDGSRVLKLDQSAVDQFIQKQFEDTKIKDEELTVGIFNGTNHPGLAEKAGRLISNMGGRVIFTTNLGEHAEKSKIISRKNDKSSYSLKRLSGIFTPGCPGKSGLFENSSSCDSESPDLTSATADINIVLGEDYYIIHESN